MSKINKIELKCKNCNGIMEVDSDKQVLSCPYCGSKEIVMDSDQVKIEKHKFDSLKDIFIEKETRKEKTEEVEKFKKSKFSKILLIFAVICAIITFNKSFNFASIISLLQSLIFIISWLMGMKIIKEKFNGLHVILAIVAFALILPFFKFNVTKEKIDFKGVYLADRLPLPNAKYGEINYNSNSSLTFDINDFSAADYQKYIDEVIKFGYNVDSDDSNLSYSYSAFNKEGYSVSIYYYDSYEEMSVSLNAPRKMSEIEWPNSGLALLLPVPKSLFGDIYRNDYNSFSVYVGDMSKEDFDNYVKECEDKGYTVEFDKTEKSYFAKNKANYELDIDYLGANVILISLDAPEVKTTTTTTKRTTTKKTTTKNENLKGIRSDFKKAMDSYEENMNDYVTFMKKFNKSGGTDITLLKDYAKYVQSYAEAVEAFEEWESEDLNDKELDYYIKVQTRVNKKLAEVQ